MDIVSILIDVAKLVLGVAIGSYLATKFMMWQWKRTIRRIVASPETRHMVREIVSEAISVAQERVRAMLSGTRISAAAGIEIDLPSIRALAQQVAQHRKDGAQEP